MIKTRNTRAAVRTAHSFSNPLFVSGVVLFVLLSMLSGPVLAHKGATGVVKERMDMMDEIGDNMKQIKAMVQRKIPFDAAKLSAHAEAIRAASVHIEKAFPEGSLKHPSEALPGIWQNWDEFVSLAKRLTVETEKMRDIAKGSDQQAIMKQFARVGKTCRSCHTDFRKKKEK